MGGTFSSHEEYGYRPSVREFKWKKKRVIVAIARRILLR
jgi:hypothetical protein